MPGARASARTGNDTRSLAAMVAWIAITLILTGRFA